MADVELTHLQDFELSLDNLNEGISYLVNIIRPGWDKDKLQITSIQGGYVNSMTHVFIPGEPLKNGLVFRVYGGYAGLELCDKNKDLLWLQAAYIAGCGAPVYAVFKNGLVVGFVPGRNLTDADFVNPEVNLFIAKAIAQIHNIEPTTIKNQKEMPPFLKKGKDLPCFWQDFRKSIAKVPESLPDPEDDRKLKEVALFTTEELLREFDEIMAMMQSLDIPLVFSHNDVHQRNSIYNEEEKKIYLVDYEICGVNYIHKDVTQHFQWAVYWSFHFGPVDEATMKKAQDDKVICSFIRAYLEAKREVEGKPASDVSEDDVWELKLLTDLGTYLADFVMLVIGPLLSTDKRAGVDGLGCAIFANKRYKENKCKERMFEIGEQYKEFRKARQQKQAKQE